MPQTRECDYCGDEIEPGTGTMFVRTNGTTIHYCSSKCEANADLGREPRDVEWTREGRDQVTPEAETPGAEPVEPESEEPDEAAESSEDGDEAAETSEDEAGEAAEASEDEAGEAAETSEDEAGEAAEASEDEAGESGESATAEEDDDEGTEVEAGGAGTSEDA